jgi:hypothetical protein
MKKQLKQIFITPYRVLQNQTNKVTIRYQSLLQSIQQLAGSDTLVDPKIREG